MEELLEKKEEPDKKKDRVLVVIIIVLAAALAVIKIVEFIADGEFQQTDATNENVIIQWRGKTVEEPYIIEVSKNKQDGYRKVGHIYVDTRNHNICSTYIHDLILCQNIFRGFLRKEKIFRTVRSGHRTGRENRESEI